MASCEILHGHAVGLAMLIDSMDPQSHRRRLKREDGCSHARFLTFSCFRRQPFLTSDRTRNWMRESIIHACDSHGFVLCAWVLMPDHVHVLVFPCQTGNRVGPLLKTMKLSVAKHTTDWVKKHAPDFLANMADISPSGQIAYRFWQRGGGFDRNLFEFSAIEKAIDYIHNNPVRRGLVERAEDWQWSSAIEHAAPGTGLIPLDFEAINRFLRPA